MTPGRGHMKHRLLSVLLGALPFIPAEAHAERVNLRWEAPAICPDQAAVRDDVERLLQQSLKDASLRPLFARGVVTSRGDDWLLVLELKTPDDLRERLPELLWTYQMGIILFWIHDDSPGRARTHRLVRHTAELVARLIALASHPLVKPLRRKTIQLLDELDFGLPTPSG